MSAIVTSAEIDRPAADVFAYATDPTRSPNGRRASSTATWTAAGSVTGSATVHHDPHGSVERSGRRHRASPTSTHPGPGA